MRTRVIVVLLGIALGACQSASMEATFELRDGSISGPSNLLSDVSSFNATNTGELPHTLVVTSNDGTVIAATDLVQPGETMELAVDLHPGMFQVSCRIVAQNDEGQLLDHYELGMRHTVDITATG